MGLKDIFLMICIVGGAIYLLYLTIWKKKGHCSGCSSNTCGAKKNNFEK